MAANEERDYIYDMSLKIKSDAKRRRAESDAVLESVYEVLVNSKKRTAVYLADEPEE